MSKKNIVNVKYTPTVIIAIQDITLQYILSNRWEDYKNFARICTDTILLNNLFTELEIFDMLTKMSHPFFTFNNIDKSVFIKLFPSENIINRLKIIPRREKYITEKQLPRIIFRDLYPRIEEISIKKAETLLDKLDIYERIIQNELRNYFREKGASNMYPRKSDTSLEVADLEDFTLKMNDNEHSFTAVVKGYKSINKERISLQDISHQILKANDTNPDYILLVIAKPLVDGVITRLVKYGKDIGNRNLIMLVDPIDLVRFLSIRKVI